MEKVIINSTTMEKVISYLFSRIAAGTLFRFLNLSDLKKTIIAAKNELFSKSEDRITTKIIIDHLLNTSILHKVNTSYTKNGTPFFYLGFKNEIDLIQPAEILHSINKEGVLCFFSAFEIYELTTQYAPYYHIAEQKNIFKDSTNHTIQPNIKIKRKTRRDILGTKEIVYNEIPYYLTRRNKQNILSVKYVDIRGTKIKIVSIEQCLIDCFLYDEKSGGINIITEVWENAINLFNSNTMFEILKKMNKNSLNRKIGFYFDYLNFKPSIILTEYLQRFTNSAGDPIQLINESEFIRKNNKWNILGP